MEGAVVEASAFSAMLSEAQQAGDFLCPEKLLATLKNEEDGRNILSDPERAERLFSALREEFGYFPNETKWAMPLASGQRERWVRLLRWTTAQLAIWAMADDPGFRRLTATLVIAQSVGGGQCLWTSMPSTVRGNLQLIHCLQSIVRSTAIEFGTCKGLAEPIWEREAVELFKDADAREDWVQIGKSLRLFEHQLFRIGPVFNQAVKLLACCGTNQLVSCTSALSQTLVALQVANALPRAVGLALAAESENHYLQFACVLRAVKKQHSNRPLSSSEKVCLSSVLLKVSQDTGRWRAWMKVFAEHSVRYPLLQKSLGATLAVAPQEALHAYISTISLFPWPAKGNPAPGRMAVAECLESFRETAVLERRHYLWQLAHDRWVRWNFGQEVGQHLFEICWSDLDFAIVAFASECLDETRRVEEIVRITSVLEDLDQLWFASVLDFKTAWFRALSLFQPFAHASEAKKSEIAWLCATNTYLPYDPKENAYIQAKFAN